MQKSACMRYSSLLEQLETDEEYLELNRLRLEQEFSFQAVLRTLTKDQRSIITDYIGICSEMCERSVEIACFIK